MNTNHHIFAEERLSNSERCDPYTYESDCCRTCLSTDNLMLIFGNFGEEKMSQNLKLVTGLEIRKNDGLPQKVCTKCLETFNFTLQFRHKCQQAEQKLLNMITVKPNTEYSLEIEVPKLIKIELENDDYEHEEEEEKIEPKVTKVKVERDSENIDIEYTPKMSEANVQVEVHKHKNMLVVSPLNSSAPGGVQSEDDFEWKEEDKPVQKQKKQRNPKPQKEMKRRRILLPNGPPYPCEICCQELDTKATYVKHYKLHAYIVCELCGKRFVSNRTLLMHKRAKHGMEKIYSCTQCHNSFSTKVGFTIHVRRHTGERPFICDHCGAAFHRRSNLVQHLPTHLPEWKYLCSQCPHRSKSRKLLQIHMYNAHISKEYR